ncbi:MAG: hypothetical protein KBT10_00690 [Bacteroidales bacterium]|nr:hypothetical protein [Candidatus Sodaliphilus aphodohippi]
MNKFTKLIIAALLCCVAIGASASPVTQADALQAVKDYRTAASLSNSDVNFYIAQVDSIINNRCCPVAVMPTETWRQANIL